MAAVSVVLPEGRAQLVVGIGGNRCGIWDSDLAEVLSLESECAPSHLDAIGTDKEIGDIRSKPPRTLRSQASETTK